MAHPRAHDLSSHSHSHVFDAGNVAGERRTWIVIAITAVTMVAEVVAGWITGSMALLADGWHMGTHVAALAIAAFAYRFARKWSADARFAFGTWKVEVLGAFSSALVLGLVALAIAVESVVRLARPEPIDFRSALVVAVIGLAVNLLSAWILGGDGHGHGHGHDHGHDGHEHGHGHEHGRGQASHGAHAHKDLNLQSAYAHVLTDAFTSILAIIALLAGLFAGWTWLDPAMGLVGAGVIAWWSRGLMRESSRVLLDREMDSPLVSRVRAAIESDGDAQVADLHLWRVGRERYACIVCVVADAPFEPDTYRARVAALPGLAHVTIEVNRCTGQADCRTAVRKSYLGE
jgi:cation diffusion facilitator family transporter